MTTSSPRRPVRVAAVGLDHTHVFGQVEGLLGQGCDLVGLSSDDATSVSSETHVVSGTKAR